MSMRWKVCKFKDEDLKILSRAGASTRFTSTSTCNMCEYESEYLIITRVRVLVDEYEYKHEYQSTINILYSMYSSVWL